jgi:putative tricarboxylic transport membrane protein
VTASSIAKRSAYLGVGSAALALSAGYLLLSLALPFGDMEQPGAAVFPLAVAALMAVASLATLHEGWRMAGTVRIALPAGPDRQRVLVMLVLLLGYVLLLPFLGQLASSALFFMFALRLLSQYAWPRVAVYALCMAVVLHGVFVLALKVPMPKGMLDF